MCNKVVGFAIIAAAMTSIPAWAHHSNAHYEPAKTAMIKGTVTEYHLINPHSWVFLTVTGENGVPQEWALASNGSVGRLVRESWSADSMKSGDVITATVYPLRDGSYGGLIISIMLADGTVLGSPD